MNKRVMISEEDWMVSTIYNSLMNYSVDSFVLSVELSPSLTMEMELDYL